MKYPFRSVTLFAWGSVGAFLVLSVAGCNATSTQQSGLRTCYDTGAGVTCVSAVALSTDDKDVNHDGHKDKFVCADDDNDNHDRDRDRDHSGRLAARSDHDEDHDGVDDDCDCGHRNECHALTNEEHESQGETGDDHGGETEKHQSALSSDAGGHSSGEPNEHHADGGVTSDNEKTKETEKDDDKGDDHEKRDDHPASSCTPPTMPPVSNPPSVPSSVPPASPPPAPALVP